MDIENSNRDFQLPRVVRKLSRESLSLSCEMVQNRKSLPTWFRQSQTLRHKELRERNSGSFVMNGAIWENLKLVPESPGLPDAV